ncbi:MAG: virulence RhuM family protein [Proteobacteria bacterium]|nr:virulence RhuM family protein [Pseudomonadota bacterium]
MNTDTMKGKPRGEIVLYRTEDGQTRLDVRLEQESIWLSLAQMVILFERDKSVISRHLSNIFKSNELERNSVVAKNATTASDGKSYMVDYYNLDAIISVGYRVNSKRGTEFRIWATQVLKDHVLKGYSINEKRLKEQNERLLELQQTVSLLGRIIEERQLAGQEAEGLLKVIADYSMALKLLDDYDHNRIAISDTTEPTKFVITYEAARRAINKLAKESDITQSGLFGREKDDSFKSSLGGIYQTFDGKELYPSVEEKAAHLLYFVVKNHSFIDGNSIIPNMFLLEQPGETRR